MRADEPQRWNVAAWARCVTASAVHVGRGIARDEAVRRTDIHRAYRVAGALLAAVVLAASASGEAKAQRSTGVELTELAQLAEVSVSPGRGGRIGIDLAAPG